MHTLGNLVKQGGGDHLVGWVLLGVNGNEQLLGLGVDIADIDTTLMCEENPVALDNTKKKG